MIEYYEQLSEEEQDDIKNVIQTLYRQISPSGVKI